MKEDYILILDCSLQNCKNKSVLFCFLRNIFSICKSVGQYFVMVGPEN